MKGILPTVKYFKMTLLQGFLKYAYSWQYSPFSFLPVANPQLIRKKKMIKKRKKKRKNEKEKNEKTKKRI